MDVAIPMGPLTVSLFYRLILGLVKYATVSLPVWSTVSFDTKCSKLAKDIYLAFT